MDDQQENVIDELARARQWRRSRSKPAHPTSEAAEARSDAPKSIADSLLVPAKMLTRAASVGDQLTDEQRSGAAAQPARDGEESRHVDFMWPYWNILDYTPEGRPVDNTPRLDHG
jgi:hypothetical protein